MRATTCRVSETCIKPVSCTCTGTANCPTFITTYVYKNNSTYPTLFEFISELLHKPIPIALGGAKFGLGEIIVNGDNVKAVRGELSNCVIELQKLIFSKKT